MIWLDLAPDWNAQRVMDEPIRPHGARSMSSHLQNRLNITDAKLGLLRGCLSKGMFADLAQLARAIETLPLRLIHTRPIEETISIAGGVTSETLNVKLMIERLSGAFCTSEMLDWEVPTSGYLLTARFAGNAAVG